MSEFLLLKNLRIQNANALADPYVAGFPAMTGWLGFMKALERQVQREYGYEKIQFSSLAVCCHKAELQAYKGKLYSLMGMVYPMKIQRNTLVRPSFIPEARIHLSVSLLIRIIFPDGKNKAGFPDVVKKHAMTLKAAGGDILSVESVSLECVEDEPQSGNKSASVKRIFRRMMPGYVLIERRELLERDMRAGWDAMQALLRYLRIYHVPEFDEEGNCSWNNERAELGWLVPIAVGYQRLGPLGKVKNQRDPEKEHCFVESVVTLGEWVLPVRLHSIEEMMWHTEYIPAKQLYLCKNAE